MTIAVPSQKVPKIHRLPVSNNSKTGGNRNNTLPPVKRLAVCHSLSKLTSTVEAGATRTTIEPNGNGVGDSLRLGLE